MLRVGKAHVFWARPEFGGDRTLLTTEEQARLDQFLDDNARQQYLTAHTLLRTSLAQFAGDVRWSLSHTVGLVACAITEGVEVGIDVELMQSETEDFYREWTMREACFKAPRATERHWLRPTPDHMLAIALERGALADGHEHDK